MLRYKSQLLYVWGHSRRTKNLQVGKGGEQEGVKRKAAFQNDCVCLYVLKLLVGFVSVWLQDIFYQGAIE